MPLWWAGRALALTLPLVVLGLGLIYIKLLFGAVPLHFLVEPIRHALSAELDGIDIAIADAALHRNASGGIEVRLKGLALSPVRGQSGVHAAEALVGLDIPALWSGRIAASRIVLVGPRFVLAHYGADPAGPRSSQGRFVGPQSAQAPTAGLATPAASAAAANSAIDPGQRIDLAKGVADVMAHLRRGGEATSHLRAFGLRNAVLEVEGPGRRAIWAVPELELELDHEQNRSVLTGEGRVAVDGEAFGIAFRLTGSEGVSTFKLETQIEGLRPSILARNFPHLGLIGAVDVGVTGRGEMELSSAGELIRGRFDVDLARGGVVPSALGGLSVGVDGGKITLLYSGAERRLEVAPSTIQLEGSWVRLKGALVAIPPAGGREAGWSLELDAIEGALAGARDARPVPIERLAVRARLWPSAGASELVSLVLKAGMAEVEARGSIVGGDARRTSIEGRIGPMGLETIKSLWPAAHSPTLREAVVRSLVKGQLKGGTFRAVAPGLATSQFTVSLEAEDLAIAALDGLPPVLVPRALLTRTDDALEISVPDATVTASANRRIALKGSTIAISGLGQPRPQAEVSGRAQTTLATLVELAGRDALGLVKPGQVPPGTDAKVEAQWKATLPVGERLALTDIKLDAKARLTDGRIPNVIGPHDVTGASFTIGASERTIDVKGEMLLAGVLAKASGQWILGEGRESQSPILVTARLDANDRRQLGLGLDEEVLGEVPVEVQFTPSDGESGKVQVNADLTGAELVLDGLAWRKPPGRTARLAFDVVRPKGTKLLELQGFRISGDSIAIDGTVTIGADGQAQSYRFPGFSLNVVSNLEVEGVRRPDKVWDIVARGKTFDGGEIMRSLYAVETGRPVKSTGAMALDARIDTVIGLNDTTVKQAHLRMRRNGDQLVALEFDGVLDTGHPIEARLRPGQGRVVHVHTPDAGQALRTIGFYTSMLGGKGDLWVNLDARGAAERSGQIQVNRFRILGDPIVSELVQNSDDQGPAIAMGKDRAPRRVVREEIAFDTLRGSFASGNGQVAIESLAAAGSLIGASVRGKMDFRTRTLSLGGTYVPLSGLNRALAGIPLFGELLTGPKGDGIIGITFAVDGPMAKPNVIINPLSMVAPGVLREIFQMAPDNPRVTPSEANRASAPAARPRSGQPEPLKGAPTQPGASPRVLDGWSSDRTPPARP